ncbi:type II toxin-antitoxin system ParD family antitoxin [Polycladidibacter stylochi]|uniref:type II toxin-antitoxin system ParD family antitoxin n=1 Tax=Polycladidibacter stylochi TaxID=1807766 RepID=UPI00082CCAA4|nr:type II toxin-antitoxin system ParD family antitoxin [Pseudovibrio stylochi]
MHVSLTDRLDEYVREKVSSGLYNNASEVIREALRLKMATDESEELKLQCLRDAIEPAWQQAERGEFADYSLEKSLNKLKGKP